MRSHSVWWREFRWILFVCLFGKKVFNRNFVCARLMIIKYVRYFALIFVVILVLSGNRYYDVYVRAQKSLTINIFTCQMMRPFHSKGKHTYNLFVFYGLPLKWVIERKRQNHFHGHLSSFLFTCIGISHKPSHLLIRLLFSLVFYFLCASWFCDKMRRRKELTMMTGR